jgi:hypothetical protein
LDIPVNTLPVNTLPDNIRRGNTRRANILPAKAPGVTPEEQAGRFRADEDAAARPLMTTAKKEKIPCQSSALPAYCGW